MSSLGIKSLQSHAKSEKHKVAVKGLQRVQVLFGSVTNGAFPLHGTARYGSLLGGFPLGTVPGT